MKKKDRKELEEKLLAAIKEVLKSNKAVLKK